MMRKHDDVKQAAERFRKAVEAVLSYRRNLEHHAVAPIKEWIIETNPDTGVSNFPYARYQAEVYNFFTALGEFLDLWTPLATDYQETASRFQRDHDAIGTAGPDEVKALVTWVFRGERFCEGFLGQGTPRWACDGAARPPVRTLPFGRSFRAELVPENRTVG